MKLFYYIHRKHQQAMAINPETIDFYELTMLINGEFEYSIDGQKYPMRPSDVVFLKKGSLRKRTSCPNTDYVSFNFYTDEDEDFNIPPYISGGVSNEIALLIKACDEIRAQLLPDSDRLGLILSCVLKQLSVNIERSKCSPLVHEIKQYIHSNVNRNFTVADVAKTINFSKSLITSVFKKETGQSIIAYAINAKIDEAKILIVNGAKLRQVADQLGFLDYNYFSRLFKKKTGLSPVEYRKTLLK